MLISLARRDLSATMMLLALTIALTACESASPPPQTTESDGPDSGSPPRATMTAADTAAVYANRCAVCHGKQGRGDGPAAYLLFPKPRDFTAGVFRFKSTPSAQPPTADDLHRVITGGIARTAMPSFAGLLSNDQVKALGNYVLSLGPKRDANEPLTPLQIPQKPAFTADLVEQGRLAYMTAGCAACHGEKGQGDGQAALTLKDSNGYPLPPADFTTGVFKAGRTSADLYRTIMIGVPGTPMPSFVDAIQGGFKVKGVRPETDMAWAMVAYLESLISVRERPGIAAGADLHVVPVDDDKLLDESNPYHGAWDRVPATAVSIQPLWQRRHAPRSVEIRAVRTKDRIALCLEWADPTFNATDESLTGFTDAVGVMFGLGQGGPALTVGQRGGDTKGGAEAPAKPAGAALVNIWQWKADRQLNADQHRLHDALDTAAQPGVPADLYMFKKGDLVRGPITEHDRTYVPAWGVDNPKANPALIRRSVLESNAAGFGTLSLQEVKEQGVTGHAAWSQGRWRIVMVRRMKPSGAGDVDLSRSGNQSRRVPVAFAVWDGAAGDRNGTKLVSGWHWLVMDK